MILRIDPNICPLCGRPNACQAGEATLCWCHEVEVSEQLLQKIPEEKQGRACICQACIKTHHAMKEEDV